MGKEIEKKIEGGGKNKKFGIYTPLVLFVENVRRKRVKHVLYPRAKDPYNEFKSISAYTPFLFANTPDKKRHVYNIMIGMIYMENIRLNEINSIQLLTLRS